MAARALAGGTCSLWAAPAVQPSACLRSALRLRPTAARCPLALHTPQAEAEEEGKTRVIYVDRQAQAGAGRKFESNRVVTSKYNIITFLPIFLFEMFSRVAYLYFLLQVRPPPVTAGCTAAAAAWCAVGATAGAPEAPPAAPADPPPPPSARPPQAGLSWWSVVSPFSGYGSTAALVFVLAVAAVKAIWEDVKRHHEDKRMNTSITHRVNPDGARACCRSVGPC